MPDPVLRRRAAGNPDALPSSLHPILRRVYASRGIAAGGELALDLEHLLAPWGLTDIEPACTLLAAALRDNRHIVIVGDYDADGATSCAVAISALRGMGASRVSYLVPDRFRMGYGLSVALVGQAKAIGAELLVTVDNGVSSHAGVAAAKSAGMQVIVTDHHLAGATLPEADAMVNPNRPGDAFASKHAAGVGVIFYVMSALRARLRESGWFKSRAEPNLAELLDLVAAGTVADVVRLDRNNRILVARGLARIRAGRARPGLRALLRLGGRNESEATAQDLGFVVGPRLNAAGRLEDMRAGIECLLAATDDAALPLAQKLDTLNRERRGIEKEMRDEALAMADGSKAIGICLFDPGWHEGVVGIVASRVKDRVHRPVIAFAPAAAGGLLKGSARSIAGFHVRDALAAIDAQQPGLIERFGGHAMAAGVTLPAAHLERFQEAFDAVCRGQLDDAALERVIETDGELGDGDLVIETARALEHAGPWGQGFPEPVFDGTFEVLECRAVGEHHAKYSLKTAAGRRMTALDFNGVERAVTGGPVRAAYRLCVNRWQGLEGAELTLAYIGAP